MILITAVVAATVTPHTSSKVGSIASSLSIFALATGTSVSGSNSNSRIIKDSTDTAFVIFNQAFSNLPDSNPNSFDGSLDLNDTFSTLREHLFRGNHPSTRNVL